MLMVVAMIVMMLLARLKDSAYRISELFDGCLKSSLRGLGCIILQSHCLVFKGNLELPFSKVSVTVFSPVISLTVPQSSVRMPSA